MFDGGKADRFSPGGGYESVTVQLLGLGVPAPAVRRGREGLLGSRPLLGLRH